MATELLPPGPAWCALHAEPHAANERCWYCTIGGRCPTAIAIFCGAFAGWLDDTMAALIAAGDSASLAIALDLAEERGLGTADGRWPACARDWHEYDTHGDPNGNNPHVWFPCKRMARAPDGNPVVVAGTTVTSTTWTGVADHRCTCGRYKSDIDAEAKFIAFGGLSLTSSSGKRAATHALVLARVLGGERVLLVRPDGDVMLDSVEAVDRAFEWPRP
jgi:hypothetical protein